MNKKEFERMIDEKLSAVKKELTKTYLNSLYGMSANKYPEYGSFYYYINTFGEACYDKWTNTIEDNEKFDIGNYFETREEAEFQAERLKVIAELKRFAEPKDREWNGRNKHWNIYIDNGDGVLLYDYNFFLKHTDIYFVSKEEAIKAVEAIGEQRIKKYYLGVED